MNTFSTPEAALPEALDQIASLLDLSTKQASDLEAAGERVRALEQEVQTLRLTEKQSAAAPAINAAVLDATLSKLHLVGFMSAPSKQAAFRDISKDPNRAMDLINDLANFIPPLVQPQGRTASISDMPKSASDARKGESDWY